MAELSVSRRRFLQATGWTAAGVTLVYWGGRSLLSILPSFLSLLIPGSHSLLVVRALRLMRVFRIFKLAQFLGEANVLGTALRSSRHKVTVFLGSVMVIVVIVAALMFVIEGPDLQERDWLALDATGERGVLIFVVNDAGDPQTFTLEPLPTFLGSHFRR